MASDHDHRTHRLRAVSSALAVALAASLAAGCGPGRNLAGDTIEAYLYAVQDEDLDRLFCLSAGAAGNPESGPDGPARRAAFDGWARAELEAYLEGRDRGFVDLSSSPIPIVKTFTLGKGTYFRIDRVVPAGDGVSTVDMQVRLSYASLSLADLSPGTGFYLSGVPLGTVHRVRVPRFGGEVQHEVLDEVRVRWTLTREDAADGCPEGWKVYEANPDPATATAQTVTWVF
jgi:hypothetical protein